VLLCCCTAAPANKPIQQPLFGWCAGLRRLKNVRLRWEEEEGCFLPNHQVAGSEHWPFLLLELRGSGLGTLTVTGLVSVFGAEQADLADLLPVPAHAYVPPNPSRVGPLADIRAMRVCSS
jgi:hypothetical protein